MLWLNSFPFAANFELIESFWRHSCRLYQAFFLIALFLPFSEDTNLIKFLESGPMSEMVSGLVLEAISQIFRVRHSHTTNIQEY